MERLNEQKIRTQLALATGLGERLRKDDGLNPSETVDEVWASLGDIFGTSWVREHGEKPPAAWASNLERLEPHQIVRGLTNIIDAGLAYPVNLSEFMGYCAKETGPGVRFLGVPETDQQARARLTKKKSSPETAAKWIAKIRADNNLKQERPSE